MATLLKTIFRPCLPDPNKDAGSKNKKHLTTLSLAALIFFSVSGGPYGTEDAVAAVGAKWTLLGFLILPIAWCLPEALITAEYATAFPEAVGDVAWVAAAFGPFWGWMEAWYSFVSGMINVSAYPVLMLSYLELQWPILEDGYVRVLVLLLVSFVIFFTKYCGLEVVGIWEVINSIFVLLPFAVLLFFCIPDWDTGKWGHELKEKDWETWINVMFWNLNYWSYAANMGGETEDQGRSLPRAMIIAVFLVMFAYLVPLGSTLAVLEVEEEWDVGFLGEAAKIVAGRGLMRWVIVAAVASSIGLMFAALTTAAYLVHGLGQRGYIPKVFAARSKWFDTPTWGIWVQFIPVCLLVNLPFDAILSMINTTFSAALILGFGAAIRLRISMPDLPRPYKVPLNTVGLTLLLVPATALLVWVIAIPFYKVQRDVLICLLGSSAIGVAGWFVLAHPAVHNQKLVPFYPIQHDWTKPIHEQDLDLPGTIHDVKKSTADAGIKTVDM